MAREATGGKGIDVTLDMVGGDYTERNIVAAAEDGRIVQIATLGGCRREDQCRAADDETGDADRLDAAPSHPRGEGRLCPRARGEGLAADCQRAK